MRIPLVTIIILFVLCALVYTYILHDVRSYTSRMKRKRAVWIFTVASVLTVALVVVAICLPRRDTASSVLPVMWLMTTFLTILIPAIVYCLCSMIGRLINIGSRRLVNYGSMLGIPMAVLVFLVMWWGVLFTRRNIEIREADVVSQRVPAGFDGYRIAQISDLHVGTWGNDTTFISEFVDKVNGLNADMIVFTGDIVNRQTSEMEPFLTVLRRLHARDGVYSILGNHDYGDYLDWNSANEKTANMELMKAWQKQIGWKMLNNDFAWVRHEGDSIALIGVENWGEPPFKQYGDLRKAYNPVKGQNGLYDSNFKVLLTHNPEHWSREVVKASNIDLSLAGHTHAMQFEIDMAGKRWSPAKYRYSHWGGMYDAESKDKVPQKLYVNIGAGEVALPMRIGAVPEITVLTLKSAQGKRK